LEKALSELAVLLNGIIIGDANVIINGINGLDEAKSGDISFFANPKYRDNFVNTKASAILVKPETDGAGKNLLVVQDPYAAFGKLLEYFYGQPHPKAGIHPLSFIGENALVSPEASIYPHVYVGPRSEIAKDVILYPGVVIDCDVTIGEGSVLYPNVTVYRGCVVGKRVTLHAGVVIGSDGFGFAMPGQENRKIPQVGIVQIDDDVEIGANTTIDRATLGRTWIQGGAKIDNLVQIAHNVVIGANSIIVAQVGISGSTKIGDSVMIGGQAGVVGHLNIGDHAMIAAGAGIHKDMPPGQICAGSPQQPYREWRRVVATLPKLPEMRNKITALNRRVEVLENIIKEKEGEKVNP
jgi:UDP-3-O-[3-hydroxymyristoyl] glucosamine N-acyltransferase